MSRFLSYLLLLYIVLTSASGQPNLDSLRFVSDTIQSDSLKIIAYMKLVVEYNRNNYDSALKYAKKAEELSKKIHSNELLAHTKFRTATAYLQQNKLDSAKAELDSVIVISGETGNKVRLMQAQIELGRLYKNLSEFDLAVVELFEALKLAEELEDKNAEARLKNYLAIIYYDQKQYGLAITYFSDALELVRELNFKPGISAILTNLGDAYLTLEKFDSAKIFQQEALNIKIELEDKLGIGRVYNNLGNVFIQSHPPLLDSGLYYFSEGLKIARELKDQKLVALNLNGLVSTNYLKGSLSQAQLAADLLIKELDSLQDLSLASSSYDQISLVYAGLGNTGKALEYQDKSRALSDSLLSEESMKITQELEARYQNQTKQKTIELLESENQLQELLIIKRRNERNGLILLSIIILLVLILLYNQYHIKQTSIKKLQELDRIKSTFFENLSHEFRTPLSLILAPLKDRMSKSITAADKRLLSSVVKNAENLDELIKQLLDLAKLEENEYTLNPVTTEANAFFKLIAASYESLAAVKETCFEVNIPEGEQWLKLDQDLVRKACNNLLANAFKFTPSGGTITIEVSYQERLEIHVADTGPGIAQKDQQLIFDRFYQAEGPHASGTGIGLALTRELIEKADGTISVYSKPGEGTSFEISLPKVYSSTKDIPDVNGIVKPSEDTAEEHEQVFSEGNQSILIIEDNDDLRSFLADLFHEEYNVHTAANGQEGISIAIETIPDLIICDIMMPGIDGLEVCNRLKSDSHTDHIPIILLTARSDKETKFSGIEFGADAYIMKPFDTKEIQLITQNLILQREKLRNKYVQQNAIPNTTREKETPHKFVRQCENIVQLHLANDQLNADSFAREVGMSRMQVHRKLKALTGLSTTSFIRYYRLVKAKELIETGEYPSQVAYAVGFSSLSYFSTSFKQQFGKSPSEFSPDLEKK